MWKIKKWKLEDKAKYLRWLGRALHKYQIVVLFIDNGYGVEYRPLKYFS